MKSKKNTQQKKKVSQLSRKITDYISKKEIKDICCEEDYDRNKIIAELFKLYDDDLDTIDNDIIKFIGYKMELDKTNDKVGVKLWELIEKSISTNNKSSKNKIVKILHDLPLYYILAFLGHAHMVTLTN